MLLGELWLVSAYLPSYLHMDGGVPSSAVVVPLAAPLYLDFYFRQFFYLVSCDLDAQRRTRQT